MPDTRPEPVLYATRQMDDPDRQDWRLATCQPGHTNPAIICGRNGTGPLKFSTYAAIGRFAAKYYPALNVPIIWEDTSQPAPPLPSPEDT